MQRKSMEYDRVPQIQSWGATTLQSLAQTLIKRPTVLFWTQLTFIVRTKTVKNILQNILFYVPQRKEGYTWHEGE